MLLRLLGTAICGYLVGSFPTAVVLGRLGFGLDVRDGGSGSAGATNVLRTLGWRSALPVFAIDVTKGWVAAALLPALWIAESHPLAGRAAALGGLCAVLGHVWPVFAGFRGGKGVATGAGILLALQPVALAIGLVVFFAVVASTRLVSLGSLVAAASVPCTIAAASHWWQGAGFAASPLYGVVLLVLIGVAHRDNLRRLVRGSEPRLGGGTSEKSHEGERRAED